MSISITFNDISAAQAQALIDLAGGKTNAETSEHNNSDKGTGSGVEKTSKPKKDTASKDSKNVVKPKRETKKLTYDDARKEGEKLAANYNIDVVIGILAKYDAISIKKMNKKHYRAFISDCRKYTDAED